MKNFYHPQNFSIAQKVLYSGKRLFSLYSKKNGYLRIFFEKPRMFFYGILEPLFLRVHLSTLVQHSDHKPQWIPLITRLQHQTRAQWVTWHPQTSSAAKTVSSQETSCEKCYLNYTILFQEILECFDTHFTFIFRTEPWAQRGGCGHHKTTDTD